MYKTDYLVNASKCGDNCAKWILEIAKRKDLTIVLEHLMDFGQNFDAKLVDTSELVHTEVGYIRNAIKLIDIANKKIGW